MSCNRLRLEESSESQVVGGKRGLGFDTGFCAPSAGETK
jgi:hypothetical protein